MKGKSRIIAVGLIFMMLLPAAAPVYSENTKNEPMVLNIEDAVKLGLQNSVELKQVQNQIDLSALADERSRFLSNELHNADKSLNDGAKNISMAEVQLANVENALKNPAIDAGTKQYMEQMKSKLEAGIQSGKSSIAKGRSGLSDALNVAGQTFANKLDLASMQSLGVDSTGNLMTTMSQVSLEVTKSSYDIYKNQIAMLIKKSYYDALKAQKMLEAKQKAVDRGKKQWDFASESYKNGMKAKDDLLLAEVYYKGTQIEYQKAQGDLKTAIIELKKNMNIPMDKEIKIKDVMVDKVEKLSLEDGLLSGMKNRLEMKKALGEETIYVSNFEYAKQYYEKITFQYKDAELNKNKAVINFEKTKRDVEASIRQSYETLESTGQMLETSKEMVGKAKESVEIAEYKYKEGFGTDSSLLKKLDIESMAGTMVEVLAAEENLSQVEEKVVEITYGYNLAKMKYLNDAGKFIY